MANLNQFYKGEAIKITVADDEGNVLVGEYSSDGEKGNHSTSPDTYKFAGLRAYPDDLNLENGDVNKIKPFKTASSGEGSGILFTIDGSESKNMEEGQYTVELIYGEDDASRTIVKTNHAFTLVGSAYKRKDSTNS